MTTFPADESTVELAGAAPVAAAKRINSLDALRGFAVLGILVMNIHSFGLPMAAYFNPTVAGGFEGANYWIWVVEHLLADLKFMSIFSMLFGAGIVLFTSRIEARGGSAGGLHYRRMAWLLLIGLLHGYLLWLGDILVLYALCGLVIYWARRLPATLLTLLGTASLLVTALFVIFFGFFFGTLQTALDEHDRQAAALVAPDTAGGSSASDPPASEPPAASDAEHDPAASDDPTAVADGATAQAGEDRELTMGMTVAEARQTLREMRAGWSPPPDKVAHEIAAMTGSYFDEIAYRAPVLVEMQIFLIVLYCWRAIGMMLLGMALFKWRVLSAARSGTFYSGMAVAGFAVGLPIIWLGFQRNVQAEFDFVAAQFVNSHFNYFGSIFVALGWIGVIMLLCRTGALAWLTTSLSAVGRMAFTNYLLHTLICTTIFNGRSGLGLAKFGDFDRVQLLAVVAGIFVIQMIVSPLWLSVFRFGPFEWLWRSLTYWRLQPMRR